MLYSGKSFSPIKMQLKKADGSASIYDNLDELFRAKRSVRNELFGSYLAEADEDGNIKPSVILTKVDEKMKSYGLYLSNLKTLRGEVSRLVADEEAERLQGTVKEMSNEQAEALMNQLKLKLGYGE